MDFRVQRTKHTTAMPLDGDFAVGVVLRSGTGDGREFEIDAVHRRAIHTDAVLWGPEADLVARRARVHGQSETGTPADAADGARGDLPEAPAVGPRPGHRIYPYRLRGLKIDRPNQVWSSDITYIRLRQGFIYLVAVMDWFSRYVLAWEVSVSLETSFCLAALDWALPSGPPDIFNTDQGSQFTSEDFTGRLESHGIEISMDGRGRVSDNIFIERLWRTVKYEEVYLKDYSDVREAVSNLKGYFAFYNHQRPHQALGYQMPAAIYFGKGKGA
jgi:putative transposase